MRRGLFALGAGLLFGAGVTVSGMVDPRRVRGFLDLFGAWDPTLAFVMAGALIPMALAWAAQRRMRRPLCGDGFSIPAARGIDARLVAGALLFGVGWGIAGLCPGPAIADLALAPGPAAVFVAAMLAGMAAHRLWARRFP